MNFLDYDKKLFNLKVILVKLVDAESNKLNIMFGFSRGQGSAHQSQSRPGGPWELGRGTYLP